jgi:hypothetical protein
VKVKAKGGNAEEIEEETEDAAEEVAVNDKFSDSILYVEACNPKNGFAIFCPQD